MHEDSIRKATASVREAGGQYRLPTVAVAAHLRIVSLGPRDRGIGNCQNRAMARPQSLRIYEQILLLALHRERGTLASGFSDLAIAGTAITELAAMERIGIDDGRRKLVNLIDDRPTGDPVFDACLARIATARRRATLKKWIPRLAKIKGLRLQATEQLVAHEVLRVETKSVFGLFSKEVFPELDPGPEVAILERLQRAIFIEDSEVDTDTRLLISLADGLDLLGTFFPKRDLRRRKKRIKQLTDGHLVAKATNDALAAAKATKAAILAASTSASVAAISAS